MINVFLVVAVLCNFFKPALAQDFSDFDGDLDFGDQQATNNANFDKFKRGSCKAHSCPGKNQVTVHKSSALKFKSNGCSYFGGKAVDDTLTPCCDVWNACHNLCGTTKDFCDETFRRCIHDTCGKMKHIDAHEEKHNDCVKNISLYGVLLKMSQCQQFEDGQKWGCECVDSSSVMDKRKKVLTQFYKLYNPKEIKKVKVLMSRATDAPKFAGIFHALFNIYPMSISRDEVKKDANNSEL